VAIAEMCEVFTHHTNEGIDESQSTHDLNDKIRPPHTT